jgi:hypothetical protein
MGNKRGTFENVCYNVLFKPNFPSNYVIIFNYECINFEVLHCRWQHLDACCLLTFSHDQASTTVIYSRGDADAGRPRPQREDGSSAHNRCQTSPAQSISGPSPAGPATTFHRLRFEIFPLVASHDSQRIGGGTRPRLHMGLVISIY